MFFVQHPGIPTSVQAAVEMQNSGQGTHSAAAHPQVFQHLPYAWSPPKEQSHSAVQPGISGSQTPPQARQRHRPPPILAPQPAPESVNVGIHAVLFSITLQIDTFLSSIIDTM